MNKRFLYSLSGVDRFQLYFDAATHRNTGTGNVIRADITLDGIIPESVIRKSIEENKWLQVISGLTLKKNFFSGLYSFETSADQRQTNVLFHHATFQEVMQLVAARDCDLGSGVPMHVDVVYEIAKTHLIFSVSHVLMDHAGMENFLLSFAEENNLSAFSFSEKKKSIFRKLSDAFAATMHVSSMSNWSMKRFKDQNDNGKPAFEIIELSEEETNRAKNSISDELKTNSLSFFLGCSLLAISRQNNLLKGKDYFVPVPVNRRTGSSQKSLLSNFISFLYFRAKDSDMDSLKKITELISNQTISQAKKNIPEKFSSLLEIFRFIPGPLYNAFIDLPSKGHAATFAFSLLSGSKLEGKKMFGKNILDVTHYAPVISPPGLNLIFSEFNAKLKIICSFDEIRITRNEVISILNTIKQNLAG